MKSEQEILTRIELLENQLRHEGELTKGTGWSFMRTVDHNLGAMLNELYWCLGLARVGEETFAFSKKLWEEVQRQYPPKEGLNYSVVPNEFQILVGHCKYHFNCDAGSVFTMDMRMNFEKMILFKREESEGKP